MPRWKANLLRATGWANILAGFAGLFLVSRGTIRVVSGVVRFSPNPYFPYTFALMCALTTTWLLGCLISGAYLLRRDVRGYLLARFLCIFQIFLHACVFILLPPIVSLGISVAMIAALAQLGHLYILSYSVLTLILLTALFRK